MFDPGPGVRGPLDPEWGQTAIHYANYLEKAVLDIPNLIKRDKHRSSMRERKWRKRSPKARRIEEGPRLRCPV
jgi:hypothetical protein